MAESASEFPTGFLWGAATAAYQIEGAAAEDGRGPSIWDTFSHTPGKVDGGDTGDVACDHYHRYPEDIALMSDLGLAAYRFSISWPRVLPAGRGAVNQAGLDFYDRLVDSLLEADIRPFPTLYHWDLPQALEDDGGWTNRATAEAFADYAELVADRLGDRLTHVATLNEPWCSAVLGYEEGIHAPGHASLRESLAASHHLNLAHGLAAARIRSAAPGMQVGVVLNFEPKHPASSDNADAGAALVAHDRMNRWYLGPMRGAGYPAAGMAATGWDMAEVAEGDLRIISAPLDFLGVNYYTRKLVDAAAEEMVAPDADLTGMGWEIYPDGLTEILTWLTDEYGIETMYVTENGAAFPLGEEPTSDEDRRAFLAAHLRAAQTAIDAGVPLRGYFVWSLLDNFEWSKGYAQRFGIVHVDYGTQQRRLRDSARWYRDVIAANAV